MSVPPARPRVLILAFQGWSDAGDATTEVLQHLGGLIDSEVLHVISAEGYVDFQVHRPKLVFDDAGKRQLEWPDTRLYGPIQRPGEHPAPGDDDTRETVRRIDGTPVTDLFLLPGVEPARDWQNFADEIVELVDVWAIDFVVILGSMFSDAPHTRPIVTTMTSENEARRAETGAVRSTYEGPAGISSVIDLALGDAGIETLSLWAQVPHYVHSTPSPKATLALLDKLEELLDIVIPRGELLVQANEWEANINRIAESDEEMTRYIRKLEENRDEELAAETTGDAIALEFEKFLKGGSRFARDVDAVASAPVQDRPAPDESGTEAGGAPPEDDKNDDSEERPGAQP
ncbi:PAC2 family protein [Leucobacter japonicus]|uniref:PAC2 family protein n=1 Tax=Leucobacter japonicus TaxID=1461259 RepID=UPI0009E25F21|nr:PAC2 family protein [Leucobacter japonicus]